MWGFRIPPSDMEDATHMYIYVWYGMAWYVMLCMYVMYACMHVCMYVYGIHVHVYLNIMSRLRCLHLLG